MGWEQRGNEKAGSRSAEVASCGDGVPMAARLVVRLSQLFEDRSFLSLPLWLQWKVSCYCNHRLIGDHSFLQLQAGWSLGCTSCAGHSWASCLLSNWYPQCVSFSPPTSLQSVLLVPRPAPRHTPSPVLIFMPLHLPLADHATFWYSLQSYSLCPLIVSLDITYLGFLSGRQCYISFPL